jgi:hypothetical protein
MLNSAAMAWEEKNENMVVKYLEEDRQTTMEIPFNNVLGLLWRFLLTINNVLGLFSKNV